MGLIGRFYLAAVVALSVVAGVQAAPGDLDNSFSGDGFLSTTVNAGAETVNAAVVQPDGKLVVVGTPDSTKFMVIRYNANGTLDTSFDADGIALIDTDPTSSFELANDVALQPDGKIVVVGYTSQSTNNFTVIRLNANGSLDTTFDGDGIFVLATAGEAKTVAVLPNGKILAGGTSFLIRLNTDGTLDTSFDGDGIRPVSRTRFERIAVLPSGKFMVGNTSWEIGRFNEDGSVDASFGSNGSISIVTSFSVPSPYKFALQADGKIVVVGSVSATISGSSTNRIAALRINTDGSMDGTFGTNGIALGPIPSAGGSGERGQAIAIQPDGKIIVGGIRSVTPVPPKTEGSDFLVIRFLSNGSLDTTFAATGTRVIDVATSGDLTAAAVDGNGKIYAAGSLPPDNNSTADIFIARLEGDPLDTTPDGFAFVDATAVEPGEFVTSNVINVAGLSTGAQVPVRVTNGELSINGSPFKNVTGFVQNGDSIVVRHLASTNLSTAVDTTLTYGGLNYQNSPATFYGTTVSDTFTSTTAAADTTPRAFVFTPQINALTGTVRTSNTVTISGINTTTPISVAGGSYSIGCNGTFTAAGGTLTKNQTVCVRHTASDQFSTPVNTVLTVGGVQATFTSTTEPQDTVPDDFKFPSVSNAAIGTAQKSAAVTIKGINMPVAVTVTGGEYSIGCGSDFVSTAGSIVKDQTICVRHTSALASGAGVTTTLKVGGSQATFTSTTVSQDIAPGKFAFEDQVNVARITAVTSGAATVTGINAATPISVTNGEYSIGCADPYVATTGTINNGQKVCVRHVSASGFSAPMVTTLDIGGQQSTFTSTTLPPDISPNLFSFTSENSVEPGLPVISDAITVLGIDAPVAVIVTNGEYSIGCNGIFTSATGNINNGETLCLRHTAAANLETTTTTSVSIGTETATFSSDTRPVQSKATIASSGNKENKPSLGAVDGWLLGLMLVPMVWARRKGASGRRVF